MRSPKCERPPARARFSRRWLNHGRATSDVSDSNLCQAGKQGIIAMRSPSRDLGGRKEASKSRASLRRDDFAQTQYVIKYVIWGCRRDRTQTTVGLMIAAVYAVTATLVFPLSSGGERSTPNSATSPATGVVNKLAVGMRESCWGRQLFRLRDEDQGPRRSPAFKIAVSGAGIRQCISSRALGDENAGLEGGE